MRDVVNKTIRTEDKPQRSEEDLPNNDDELRHPEFPSRGSGQKDPLGFNLVDLGGRDITCDVYGTWYDIIV